MEEKALLTVPEVARRLSLGRATAYRLVQQGELPSIRIGRAVRVPAQALDAWVEAHVSGGGEAGIPRSLDIASPRSMMRAPGRAR